MIAATFVVTVLPSLLVYGLRAGGLLACTMLVAAVLAALLSLIVCQLASLYWERRCDTHDVLFGELMIWGWARRGLLDRRLANASALFGVPGQERGGPIVTGIEQRVKMLRRLARDLEASDPYTHGHSRRVARNASLIASRMHLSPAEVGKIRIAAALHDVGKINTPIEILHKPDRLTDEEFAVIKRHPGDGAEMIARAVEDEELVSIVRHHHERLDGTGYPSGLAGEEIPLGARIIAVADTFDAITSARPYRRAKPHKVALDILRAEAGTQLDPGAVQALRSVYFARRPLGALAAVANLSGRLGSGLLGGAVNAARVAAVAAAAGGIGGAALLHSGTVPGFQHGSPQPTQVRRLAFAVRAGVVARRATGSGRSRRGASSRPRETSPTPIRLTPQPSGGGSRTSAPSPSRTPPSGSSQGSGGGAGVPAAPVAPPAPAGGNGGLHAGVPPGSGSPAASATVSSGSPSSPGLTASATVQPTKSAGASVTVVAKPSQPPAVAVTVTAPGSSGLSASLNLGK